MEFQFDSECPQNPAGIKNEFYTFLRQIRVKNTQSKKAFREFKSENSTNFLFFASKNEGFLSFGDNRFVMTILSFAKSGNGHVQEIRGAKNQSCSFQCQNFQCSSIA